MEKLELPVERDMGQLIGDPILFFRQNFKTIGKAFLYFIVPLLLVATVITVYNVKDTFASIFGGSRGVMGQFSPAAGPKLIWTFLSYFIFMLIYLLQQSYIAQFMVLYTHNKDTTMNDVWNALLTDWKLIVNTYLALLPLTVLVIVISAGFILLAEVLGKSAAGLLLFIFYLGVIYATIPLSNILMVRLRERLGIWASLSKCFQITSGKWWRTFGGMLMLFVIFYSFVILALMPFYLIIFIIAMNSRYGSSDSLPPAYIGVVSGVYIAAVMFFMLFLSQILYVYVGMNYFSLSELYDNYALREQIAAIGEREETYTSKQEGEY